MAVGEVKRQGAYEPPLRADTVTQFALLHVRDGKVLHDPDTVETLGIAEFQRLVQKSYGLIHITQTQTVERELAENVHAPCIGIEHWLFVLFEQIVHLPSSEIRVSAVGEHCGVSSQVFDATGGF